MKKICVLLICMLLSFTAVCTNAEDRFALRGYDKATGYQYIQLGEFPQDADSTVRPILWRVLSVENDQAYLLSEYVLFNNRIHPDDKEYIAFGGAFNQTEMFNLLNGPFEGNPVSLEERAALLKDWRVGRIHIATTSFKDQAFTEKVLVISFFLLSLNLVCSFSRALRWKLVLDLSYFLIGITINLSLSTA